MGAWWECGGSPTLTTRSTTCPRGHGCAYKAEAEHVYTCFDFTELFAPMIDAALMKGTEVSRLAPAQRDLVQSASLRLLWPRHQRYRSTTGESHEPPPRQRLCRSLSLMVRPIYCGLDLRVLIGFYRRNIAAGTRAKNKWRWRGSAACGPSRRIDGPTMQVSDEASAKGPARCA